MDKLNFSVKHIAINKTNAQIVAVVGIASFITMFCLVASKTVLSQYQYQARVISAVSNADSQLQTNISSYKSLVQSYEKFENGQQIPIGQTVAGAANDNSQIVLDALPGQYDFPGFASTIENVLDKTGLQISAVTGTDEQLTQEADNTSADPQPVVMPFGFSVTNASYASVQQLMQLLQQSIRPIGIDTLDLTASQSNLSMTVTAHTYYQPAKKLSITKETIN